MVCRAAGSTCLFLDSLEISHAPLVKDGESNNCQIARSPNCTSTSSRHGGHTHLVKDSAAAALRDGGNQGCGRLLGFNRMSRTHARTPLGALRSMRPPARAREDGACESRRLVRSLSKVRLFVQRI